MTYGKTVEEQILILVFAVGLYFLGRHLMNINKITQMTKHLTILLFIGLAWGQVYQVGDYVKDLGAMICENGNFEWSYSSQKSNKVIFISSFATW